MANCKVCLEPSGFVAVHPACQAAVDVGQSPEQVRESLQQGGDFKNHQLLVSNAKSLRVLTGLLIPLFVICGVFGAINAFEAKDEAFVIFCVILGAAVGGLVGAVIHTWASMQSALALKIGRDIERRK